MALLSVGGLRTRFHTRRGIVRAVDGISFDIDEGETVGMVGESGSGKSVCVYSLLRLLPMPPARIEAGRALFEGVDLLSCDEATLRAVRGNRIGFVFQDPMTALNPYLTVGAQIAEPLLVHGACDRATAREKAVEAMKAVGIPDALRRVDAHPHEFSGGMRQRVLIAMALVMHPKLLIADEPTTALDVTVQAQVLSLIQERQRALGMAVLLITHNLGIVAQTCQRVLVMYAGRIVESAPSRKLFDRPRHPYTAALMRAVPSPHKREDALYAIPGMPPSLTEAVPGCSFAPRCPYALARCREQTPELVEVDQGHASACLRAREGVL